MKEMTDLEKYYNKFNEDKRLTRRHGQVEFITSMKYIHECIDDRKCVKILDIGAPRRAEGGHLVVHQSQALAGLGVF